MPELPEVEIARRNLARWLEGRKIRRVVAAKTRVITPLSPAAFARVIAGATVGTIERRGKNLFAPLEGERARTRLGMRMHLGMTGKWVRRTAGKEAPRFSRVAFEIGDGSTVHYCDMRLFGAVSVGPAEPMRRRAFGDLGPDPLADGLDGAALRARLAKTKRPLKIALMDQRLIAGLGNIHAAEALWRAKLSPFAPADELTRAEANRLAKGILEGIRYAIDSEDTPEEIEYVEEGGANPFRVYDRAGEPCPRCRTPIQKKPQGGRTTYWCPSCQPRGRRDSLEK